MPIYNYKCNTCGKEFEYEQRITDPALSNCPIEVCEKNEKGSGKVVRLISKNVGVIFNGSGFYQTDYAKKGKNGSNYKPVAETANACGTDTCGCKAVS